MSQSSVAATRRTAQQAAAEPRAARPPAAAGRGAGQPPEPAAAPMEERTATAGQAAEPRTHSAPRWHQSRSPSRQAQAQDERRAPGPHTYRDRAARGPMSTTQILQSSLFKVSCPTHQRDEGSRNDAGPRSAQGHEPPHTRFHQRSDKTPPARPLPILHRPPQTLRADERPTSLAGRPRLVATTAIRHHHPSAGLSATAAVVPLVAARPVPRRFARNTDRGGTLWAGELASRRRS